MVDEDRGSSRNSGNLVDTSCENHFSGSGRGALIDLVRLSVKRSSRTLSVVEELKSTRCGVAGTLDVIGSREKTTFRVVIDLSRLDWVALTV